MLRTMSTLSMLSQGILIGDVSMRKFECPGCQEIISEEKGHCTNCDMSINSVKCRNCETMGNLEESDICSKCKSPLKDLYIILGLKKSDIKEPPFLDNKYRFIIEETWGILVENDKPNLSRQFFSPKEAIDKAYKELDYLKDVVKIEKTNYLIVRAPYRTKEEKLSTLKAQWTTLGNFEKIRHLKSLLTLSEKLKAHNVTRSIGDGEIFIKGDSLFIFPLFEDKQSPSSDEIIESLKQYFSDFASEDLIFKKIFQAEEQRTPSFEEIRERIDETKEKLETRFSLESYGATDLGPVRENNEDDFFGVEFSFSMPDTLSIGGREIKQRGLYIVCDGMGGHQKGEVASALVVRELRKKLMPFLVEEIPPTNFEEEIKEVVKEANDVLLEVNIMEGIPANEGRMGTTLVAVVAFENEIFIAHVGDSRCYYYSKGEISLLTVDHNLAMQALHSGTFKTREEAEQMRGGKVLTQAIGPREGIHLIPDARREVIRGDAYLVLCSDGLTDVVSDQEIRDIIEKGNGNLRRITNRLIQAAYHNSTRDNITVLVIRFTQKF
jgi:serine/threonine protein phosphatase PrpC